MGTIGKLAVALGVVGLATGFARAGSLDDLRNRAKQEAQKKALQMAKEKIAEVVGDKKLPDAPEEPKDEFMGLYAGTFTDAAGKQAGAEATVVGYVEPKTKVKHWDVVLTATTPKPTVLGQLKGVPDGQKVRLEGADWTGEIAGGKLTASKGGDKAELKYTVRKSPTLGAKPPPGAIVLLPFEEGRPTSLDEWTNDKWVPLSDGSALVKGGNSLTKRKFRDFKVHVEFYCPYMPERTGQGRANSGCYMHAKYEVQVLDSFGLKGRSNEAGGIYGVSDPAVNAALPPGQWQTYDITFLGPRFGADGQVKEWPKFVEILHNGVKVQENVEVKKVTTAGKGKEHVEAGEIMLQDHGNPVRFRNIWLVELKG